MGSKRASKTMRNRIVFLVVVVLWFALDRASKTFFEENASGALAQVSLGNIVEVDLVHNYGAAWGSFAGMVDGLILVTTLLIVLIALFALFASKRASLMEMIGLALIFAGGLGNLYDRVVNGYVIDFIAPLFVDFPTFNIADIGITCGIIIVLIAFAFEFFAPHHAEQHSATDDK